MRSPFPGMDPFLEDPLTWSDLHARLLPAISDQLTDLVAPDYFVRIDSRVYIATPDEPGRAGVITAPALVTPQYPHEVRERYLEIRDSKNRAVVTTIEVLSPSNKRPDSPGRVAFLDKRRTIMVSPVHWLEIDLLRAGERPPEVAGRGDYYVLLKRGSVPEPLEVWDIDLRDRLPMVAVPLRPPHPDVPLDLQLALADVYARARYADTLDNTGAVPGPRLSPSDAGWVDACLLAWRPAGASPPAE